MKKTTLIKDVVNWIKRRIEEAGAKGILLGLSGGLDSSCAAILCKMAAGDDFMSLILPCGNNPKEEDFVYKLTEKFKIKTEKITLDTVYDKFLNFLPEAGNLTKANLKPRLRMVVLYYYAGKLNYLVAGCSNKSEIMVGYFTKHGDGAADILPLGDFFKTELNDLAKDLGIPDEIIKRAPSAGLWPGQTDEEELGLTYNQLDEAIKAIENKKEDNFSDKKTLEKVKRLIKNSEHKRVPVPIYKNIRRDNDGF